MLIVAKGPCTYEDIRTINNMLYPSFKETCFTLGFLEDDKEYIKAIREAKDWTSGHFLRKLFVTILISNIINKSEDVWANTWQWLSGGIFYEQRRLTTMHGTKLKKKLPKLPISYSIFTSILTKYFASIFQIYNSV